MKALTEPVRFSSVAHMVQSTRTAAIETTARFGIGLIFAS